MESAESINEKSAQLLEELYTEKDLSFDETIELLSKFRILTREKNLRPELLDDKCIKTLVELSAKNHTEAQKCLSNLILNYAHFRELVIEDYIKCAEERFRKVIGNEYYMTDASNSKQIYEVLYYDLRIVFLLSALCSSSRATIRDRLLEVIFRMTEREADGFSQENSSLVIESLKTIFNLTLDKLTHPTLAGRVIIKLFNLLQDKETSIKCNDSGATDLKEQLLVNLINLLTNMPEEVYCRLSSADVNTILHHLDSQLISYSVASARETILPVLNVCANICKFKEEVRKRWFEDVVGSSKNFEKRPEEYDTLRGRIVKLMTSVDVHLKDIAAEFMYALCGRDTEKFITYTGFGNSAAFLSSRGLLGGLNERNLSGLGSGEETAYREIRDKIDPMTGKIEVERKNPMDGMTEEEKEYHAHELASAITKLTNIGLVKPMSINPDTGEMKDLLPSTSQTLEK